MEVKQGHRWACDWKQTVGNSQLKARAGPCQRRLAGDSKEKEGGQEVPVKHWKTILEESQATVTTGRFEETESCLDLVACLYVLSTTPRKPPLHHLVRRAKQIACLRANIFNKHKPFLLVVLLYHLSQLFPAFTGEFITKYHVDTSKTFFLVVSSCIYCMVEVSF